MNSEIIIFKNDAVGDLTHSLKAINNIVLNNEDKNIIIYLSERSKNFSFLINKKNITFKIINYNLTLIQKIKVFYFILTNNISKIYILTPKSFYFLLPPIFKKIKFYAICMNGLNNYKRPNNFLRKYLFKYVINDRETTLKRDSIIKLQINLTNENNVFVEQILKFKPFISEKIKLKIKEKYFFFHLKKKILDELGWGIDDLKLLFNKFLEYTEYVYITKDIEKDDYNKILKENFNSYDLNTDKYINNSSKVLFFDNIEGKNLYNIIKHSKKTIAFHGMMTNLASIEEIPVLDLFYVNLNNLQDYKSLKNSFYEFKPNYKNYDFILPSKDINKTLKKITYSLKK